MIPGRDAVDGMINMNNMDRELNYHRDAEITKEKCNHCRSTFPVAVRVAWRE
jgi:hypothetical protein